MPRSEERGGLAARSEAEAHSLLVYKSPAWKGGVLYLGSACLELDHHADMISYEEYHPYGTSAYRAMKSGVEVSRMRYRYTGMERDEESGLSYHTKRYYHSALNRWISVDPTDHELALCRYGYISGNPIANIDRSGEAPPKQNITPDSLVQDATGLLDVKKYKHLDRGSNQAILAESQSSGVIGDPTHNTFTHHIDDVENELRSATKTNDEIKAMLRDKSAVIKGSTRERLVNLQQQLEVRTTTVQQALDASNTLNREFRSRLTGVQLPAGQVVEDSLAVHSKRTGVLTTLLPDDSRYAGLLESINRLPVRENQKAAPLGPNGLSSLANQVIAQAKNAANVAPIETPTPLAASASAKPLGSLPVSLWSGVGSAISDEAKAMRAMQVAELAAGEAAVMKGATAVAVGIGVAQGGYHAYQGKYFRASMDVASITGVPFNILPDFVNLGLDAAGGFFSMLAISHGAGIGVRSFWSSFVPSADPYRY